MKLIHGFRRFFRLSAFRPDPEGDLDAELSFHFLDAMEDLSIDLVEEGIEHARKTLTFLEKRNLQNDQNIDMQIDTWLLKMHAKYW